MLGYMVGQQWGEHTYMYMKSILLLLDSRLIINKEIEEVRMCDVWLSLCAVCGVCCVLCAVCCVITILMLQCYILSTSPSLHSCGLMVTIEQLAVNNDPSRGPKIIACH
jgi:hypothetical protein